MSKIGTLFKTSLARSTVLKCQYGTSSAAQLSVFKIPKQLTNEPIKSFGKNDQLDWDLLKEQIFKLTDEPMQIPLIINGEKIYSKTTKNQYNPSNHKQLLSTYSVASTKEEIDNSIGATKEAKQRWMSMPFIDRASIFWKAADLISTKYRYKVLASTMLSQGKNVYQAEIDSVCELVDFLRFNVKYANDIYGQQPIESTNGVWNRLEYRPLEGFVYAITPFNFTAIASNLICAPAMMGNTVIWKPSDSSILSNYIILEILHEAGLPKDVINFIPGDPVFITDNLLSSREFAALHFTGSTKVFQDIYGKIAQNIGQNTYREYPRIVGETGGKNYHIIHESCSIPNAVLNTLRGSFEFQGQKCSATSRCFVSDLVYDEFVQGLISNTKAITAGNPSNNLKVFMGPVIHEASFDKLSKVIDNAKDDPELSILSGGSYSKEDGYFVEPTIIETSNPNHPYLRDEFFGPILTIYKYQHEEIEGLIKLIDESTQYGLTGSVFANDREVIRKFEEGLRFSSGNFYINDKSTGAVVGQQPFGGSRMSGTNDKAGSQGLLSRFVSVRSIKENFHEIVDFKYPSNY